MASKQKRIIGDARKEMDPNVRAERDGEWTARNMDSRNPSSLGSSRWGPRPKAPAAKNSWRLDETREEIFARMARWESRTLSDDMKKARVAAARRKVYEDLYAQGRGSGDVAASAGHVDYLVDVSLWTDNGKPSRRTM